MASFFKRSDLLPPLILGYSRRDALDVKNCYSITQKPPDPSAGSRIEDDRPGDLGPLFWRLRGTVFDGQREVTNHCQTWGFFGGKARISWVAGAWRYRRSQTLFLTFLHVGCARLRVLCMCRWRHSADMDGGWLLFRRRK